MKGEIGIRDFQRKEESSIPVNYYERLQSSHQPCSNPPIQEYSPKHRSLKMEIHKIKSFWN